MEDEEVQALEQVAVINMSTEWYYRRLCTLMLIVFLVHTGLRCGELQALKWSDIDFRKQNGHGQQKSFDDLSTVTASR